MKKFKSIVFILLFVLLFAGIASAVPTTWNDSIDWNPDKLVSDSFSFTLDISNDGFLGILEGGNDLVYGYSLSVGLYDDGGRFDWGEVAYIDQPGLFGDGFYNFSYSNQNFGWSLAGLVSLNINGDLYVTINSWSGDFYLDSASLHAWGGSGDPDPTTAPVPEPSTMLLMGAGLMGIAAVGRKRRKK